MNNGEREGLIAKIRQVRRVAPVRDRPPGSESDQQEDRMRALETRLAHLEQMVQGLQDSVHRESDRHSKMIGDLQAQVEPSAMSAALADDARLRGL